MDHLQNYYKYLYKGIVLDIGGRDRGIFIKPKEQVDKWIFADINREYNPDIILDVSNMTQIDSNSIDIVNAIELFERPYVQIQRKKKHPPPQHLIHSYLLKDSESHNILNMVYDCIALDLNSSPYKYYIIFILRFSNIIKKSRDIKLLLNHK